MGAHCCDHDSNEMRNLSENHLKVLWIVLFLNSLMFVVEMIYSFRASSLALFGDAFDMLGDATTYAVSIYVVNRGVAAKNQAAKLKAYIIIASALLLLGGSMYRSINFALPSSSIMSAVSIVALCVNLLCLLLLTRHKSDDVNMKSVWICSRNDIIANVSVIIAAGFVGWFQSPWPDLVIGMGLTVLFVKSAASILGEIKSTDPAV